MKSIKKVLSVLLTAILVIGLIACSKDATESKDVTNDSKNSTNDSKLGSDSTATGKKVKITYSMWGSAEEGNITQQVADKFNASQVISKERMARIVRIIDFISKNC